MSEGDDLLAALTVPIATAEDSVVAKLEWFRLTNETSERQWDDVSKLVALLGDALDVEHMQRMAASDRGGRPARQTARGSVSTAAAASHPPSR